MFRSTQLTIGLVIVAGLSLLVWLYGIQQYQKGYQAHFQEAQIQAAQILEETRQKEHQMLLELDEAYQDAYVQKQISEATITSLASDVDRLRSTINSQRNLPPITVTSPGVVAGSSTCWNVLEESIGRYAEVAGEADRWVDVLRKSQGWGRVVDSTAKTSAN